MSLSYLFPGEGQSWPMCFRKDLFLSPRNAIFCVSSALCPEESPRQVARSRSKPGVGCGVCVCKGGVLRSCLFPVARGKRLVLLGSSLPRRTDWPPSPSPRQHASLLRPDWPRPALNSGRLISFTKVKGARLGGGGAQTGGCFIPQRLDWSP